MRWKILKFKKPILSGVMCFLVGLLGGFRKGELASFDVTVILKIFGYYFILGFAIAWIYSLFKRDAD